MLFKFDEKSFEKDFFDKYSFENGCDISLSLYTFAEEYQKNH